MSIPPSTRPPVSSRLLNDWEDVKLLLSCANLGSFAAAARALGIDQSSASRRIENMEVAIGRPLFRRQRSGAKATAVCHALLEQARKMAAAAAEFEATMRDIEQFASPKVTIASSEGLLTYTLIPALLGPPGASLSLDPTPIRQRELPQLSFASLGERADITLSPTNPGEVPNIRGRHRVRKIGSLKFVPFAGETFLRQHRIDRFDDLAKLPIVDNTLYSKMNGLDDWNGVVARHKHKQQIVISHDSSSMYAPVKDGRATIVPDFSGLYCHDLQAIEITSPTMFLNLWLIAHEDSLREPEVRYLYNGMAEMLSHSPWYRPLR
jgi:molybdate transport repressor ModE-like protein